MQPEFKDAQQAFCDAIATGRLSDNRVSPLYAGHYMYMGTYDGVDQFKHCDTRQYLPVVQPLDGRQ